MSFANTKITQLNIHFGENDVSGAYIKRGWSGDLYGFFFSGDVSLCFDSKKSVETMQNTLAELKGRWLVEEQSEVTERA